MVVQPNQSQFVGSIKKVQPCDDGWGSEIKIEILQNELDGSQSDFISPKVGQVLEMFLPPRSKAAKFVVGDTMRMNARLLAGPTGERIVLVAAEPYHEASEKKAHLG